MVTTLMGPVAPAANMRIAIADMYVRSDRTGRPFFPHERTTTFALKRHRDATSCLELTIWRNANVKALFERKNRFV
jgi:hypothetical protein